MSITALFLFVQKSEGQHLVTGFEMPTPKATSKANAMAVSPDGKIFVAGTIDFADGIPRNSLVRLLSNGSLDFAFQFNLKKTIIELGLLSTGEIIALDRDSLYKISASGNVIKRLKTGVLTSPSDMQISGDYIFLVANNLLRKYDASLVLDPTFKNDNAFAGGVANAVAIQGTKVLVGGSFNQVNGITQNDIARFGADGIFDNTFVTGSGTTDYIGGLVVQGDDKVLLTKTFINSFDGSFFSGIARLNANGGIDTGFSPPGFNGPTNTVVMQGSKILVSAFFNDFTTTSNRVIRLNADGTRDLSFTSPIDLITEIQLTAGNDFFANTSNRAQTQAVLKYTANGAAIAFNNNLERISSFNNAAYHDGYFIVTGDFNRLDNLETLQVGKINLLGELDANFVVTPQVNSGSTVNGPPIAVKVKSENEIFLSVGSKILKLDGAGHLVPGFQTPLEVLRTSGLGDPFFAHQFEFLSNGNIVTAGPNGIYQLDQSGNQVPGLGADQDISGTQFAFDLQENQVIYGGVFTQLNSQPVNKLARLNLNGTIDNAFAIGTGPSSGVSFIKAFPNGSTIVKTGTFNGSSSNLDIYALDASGGVDAAFLTNANTIAPASASFVDGVLHNGSFLFTYFNSGYQVKKMAFNGALSSTFSLDSDVLIRLPGGNLFLRPCNVDDNMFLLLGDFQILSSQKLTKGLLFTENFVPVISAATTTFETPEDTGIEMSLDDFSVTDPDNTYPDDFTLMILDGNNYSVTGYVVTPSLNFNGTLSVAVKVIDGSHSSPVFYASVEVSPVNDAPVVTGTVSPISTIEETPIDIHLNDLVVTDPDNDFPNGFTFTLSSGSNYSVAGNTIIPAVDFDGTLAVHLFVNDGSANSAVYNLSVVVGPINDIPVVTGMISSLDARSGQSLELSLNDFEVDDPDNDYPEDFTLIIDPGLNYLAMSGSIVPDEGFIGELTVYVRVDDGELTSDSFSFTTNVQVVTALGDTGGSNYRIVPNPTQGNFRLQYPAEIAAGTIYILDTSGRRLAQQEILSGHNSLSQELDLSHLSAGVYIVTLELADGRRITRKLIIAR